MAQFHKLMAAALADVPSDRPVTVAGAISAWLTLHNEQPAYPYWLRAFLAFAGRERLDDLPRDLLVRFHVHLRGKQSTRNTYDKATKTWNVKPTGHVLSHKTVRHFVRTATAVLHWAHDQGWAGIMPDVPKMPKPMRQARDVEPAALDKALDDLPDRAGAILRFIAATGCRPSEACRLEWRDVHADRGVCVLSEHKTADASGEPRTLYLTPEACEILATLTPTPGPVFTSRFGTPYTPTGLRSILRRHGGITPYQLRHSFAQQVTDGGQVPLEVVARLLGHADTKTTEHYFKVRDARAIQAAGTIKLRAPKAATA